jgi:ABC-type branched-subunit amino acid transport system substrate-binding protein
MELKTILVAGKYKLRSIKGGDMMKIRIALITSLTVLIMAFTVFSACPSTPSQPGKAATVYIGGTMSLTGAYAEDSAAVLAGFEDYAKYVNETKKMAPWSNEKFPDNVTVEVLWRDDELKPEKALSIYEELKDKGLLVEHGSGSPQVLALMDRMAEDQVGATTMAVGPYLLAPPKTIFLQYPIYTDACAAIADWFMDNWKGSAKPRVAYLTADNAMGKSVIIPEMDAYLEGAGFELVGSQLVPLVPTAPPTTQLLWLKDNKVDLALGVMINPGAQPTWKEMVRLDMGPDKAYKIFFGTASPGHSAVFAEAMGELGDGYLCAGSYSPIDDLSVPGVKFCNDIQDMYRPDKKVTHIMYEHGVAEAMTQVDALRLAMQKMSADQLTPADVLENGFYKIKKLDTGDITSTPLTFGQGEVYGISKVLVQQVQNGKSVALGTWPVHDIYAK